MRYYKFKGRDFLNIVRRRAQVKSPKKFYVYAIIVGAVSGFIALAFMYILGLTGHFTFLHLAGFDPGKAAGEYVISSESFKMGSPNLWWLFFLPIIGAFISGVLVQKFDLDAAGAGTDAMIQSFHEKEGRVHVSTPIVKSFATIAILSGGGSAGKEGPISQIGAAFGSLFSRFLGLGPKARRSLFLCGMAGALGAIFRAPLGSALTAVEVIYTEDFETDSLIPAILASVSGYFVMTSFHGFDHLFHIPSYHFSDWRELFFYLILGLLCSVLGFIFVKVYNSVYNTFEKLSISFYIQVTLGGIVVAILGLFSPESLGDGFGFLQRLMSDAMQTGPGIIHRDFTASLSSDAVFWPAVRFLAYIAVFKILTTSFTIGSGGSGGVFAPSLFIGGVLGAIVGLSAQHFFPNITTSYIPFIIVGMGGFFAGVAHAPIASVIMVCELTGDYELLTPMIVVSALSLLLSHKFSIYRGQRVNKFHSPAHEWDMTYNLLSEFKISSIIKSMKTKDAIISDDFPTRKLFSHSVHTHHTDFIIKSQDGYYKGIISLRHEHSWDKNEIRKGRISVDNLITEFVPPIRPDDALTNVLEQLMNWDYDKAPVVDDKNKLLGYISFRDVIWAYRQAVTKK